MGNTTKLDITKAHFAEFYDCEEGTITCVCGQVVDAGGEFLYAIDKFGWHVVNAMTMAGTV